MFVQIWPTECKDRLFRSAGNFLPEWTNYRQKQAEISTDGSKGCWFFFTFLLSAEDDALQTHSFQERQDFFYTETGQTMQVLVVILADKHKEDLTGTPPTATGVKTHRGYSSPPALEGGMNRKKKAKMLKYLGNILTALFVCIEELLWNGINKSGSCLLHEIKVGQSIASAQPGKPDTLFKTMTLIIILIHSSSYIQTSW